MRRTTTLLTAVIAMFAGGMANATHPADTGKQAITGSTFCDGSGTPIIGEGAPSQLLAHSDVFGPAFVKECSIGNSTVNVQATGDANAFNRLADRSRVFGVADAPLSSLQKVLLENDYPQLRFRQSEVEQIPLFIDSVAVGHNNPCVPADQPLRLRSNVLSQIYSGTITSWNHASLLLDNPFLVSCARPILLVKRTGFAGATYNFKDYLSKRNPEWNYYKLAERNETWPDRAGFVCVAEDDLGMANCINGNPGSLGYLQYGKAVSQNVRVTAMENSTLQFVAPSATECANAAASTFTTADLESFDIFNRLPFGTGGDWSTVSLADSAQGYPICNFGYVFAFGQWFRAGLGQSELRTLVDYLLTSVGISFDQANHHLLLNKGLTPLPPNIARVALQGVEGMRMFN